MPIKKVKLHHSGLPKHKHTRNYLQTYWPYIPMLLLVLLVVFFSNPLGKIGSKGRVLGDSTDISQSTLLKLTNKERQSQGDASLSINTQLNAAAQAKANDMVARNYWSHNTPEGQQPWVFLDFSNYKYAKAGENLAYGFTNSQSLIDGWMSSATHRNNLLDKSFRQVGFGIANSTNFNGTGPATVVVAMYAAPAVLGANTSNKLNIQSPTSPSVAITTFQKLTGGHVSWLMLLLGILSGIAATVLMVHHGLNLRHFSKKGKKVITSHPLLEVSAFLIITLTFWLSQTTGFIR